MQKLCQNVQFEREYKLLCTLHTPPDFAILNSNCSIFTVEWMNWRPGKIPQQQLIRCQTHIDMWVTLSSGTSSYRKWMNEWVNEWMWLRASHVTLDRLIDVCGWDTSNATEDIKWLNCIINWNPLDCVRTQDHSGHTDRKFGRLCLYLCKLSRMKIFFFPLLCMALWQQKLEPKQCPTTASCLIIQTPLLWGRLVQHMIRFMKPDLCSPSKACHIIHLTGGRDTEIKCWEIWILFNWSKKTEPF